jgi:hypothetical protein
MPMSCGLLLVTAGGAAGEVGIIRGFGGSSAVRRRAACTAEWCCRGRCLSLDCWKQRFRSGTRPADYAAEVEELGYSAVRIPDVGGDLFGLAAARHGNLDGTKTDGISSCAGLKLIAQQANPLRSAASSRLGLAAVRRPNPGGSNSGNVRWAA